MFWVGIPSIQICFRDATLQYLEMDNIVKDAKCVKGEYPDLCEAELVVSATHGSSYISHAYMTSHAE